jgi:hypothetical protein
VLEQQLVQQVWRQRQERLVQRQERHPLERLQVLELALLLLFYRKQPKKLRTMLRALGRVIFSFK